MPPIKKNGRQRDKYCPYVDGEDGVQNSFQLGQAPGLIFHNEVREGNDDLDNEHDGDERGPRAVPLIPSEGKEQEPVQKLPRRVQGEFGGGRSLTRKPLGDFVMPEVVEASEQGLSDDEIE